MKQFSTTTLMIFLLAPCLSYAGKNGNKVLLTKDLQDAIDEGRAKKNNDNQQSKVEPPMPAVPEALPKALQDEIKKGTELSSAQETFTNEWRWELPIAKYTSAFPLMGNGYPDEAFKFLRDYQAVADDRQDQQLVSGLDKERRQKAVELFKNAVNRIDDDVQRALGDIDSGDCYGDGKYLMHRSVTRLRALIQLIHTNKITADSYTLLRCSGILKINNDMHKRNLVAKFKYHQKDLSCNKESLKLINRALEKQDQGLNLSDDEYDDLDLTIKNKSVVDKWESIKHPKRRKKSWF